jgi:hypothetical protein
MTAMLSGVILVVAFGLVAAAGLVLAVALFRISGRPAAGADSDLGQNGPDGGSGE